MLVYSEDSEEQEEQLSCEVHEDAEGILLKC